MTFYSEVQVVMCNPTTDYFQRTKINWLRFPVAKGTQWPYIINPDEKWMGQDERIYPESESFCGLLLTTDPTKMNRTIRMDNLNPDPRQRKPTNIFVQIVESYKFHWHRTTRHIADFFEKLVDSDHRLAQQDKVEMGWSEMFENMYEPGEYKFSKVIQ